MMVGLDPKPLKGSQSGPPQVEPVPPSNTRQDQEIETHAALLRDEIFNIFPVTVNVTQGMA